VEKAGNRKMFSETVAELESDLENAEMPF
jgi:hypothetical protein